MPVITSVLMGNATLLVQCGQILIDRGVQISRVITRNSEIANWAKAQNIGILSPGRDLGKQLETIDFDWFLSIANLEMIPNDVLALAKRGAINFHDGPLPRYAGLNAPVWALQAGETEYGITWHKMVEAVDMGDIIAQESFAISPGETALTLNTKCYEAAIRGFDRVADGLMAEKMPLVAQDVSQRSYFARDKRPDAAARLDFSASAEQLARQVRALDHGNYWNPLALPKFAASGGLYLVTQATVEPDHTNAEPGTVLDIRADQILVATGTDALLLSGLKHLDGRNIEVIDFVHLGDVLPPLNADETAKLNALTATLAPHDGYWRARLHDMHPAKLPFAAHEPSREIESRVLDQAGATLAMLAGFAARLSDETMVDLAFQDMEITKIAHSGYAVPWVPLRVDGAAASFQITAQHFDETLRTARKKRGFASDLAARMPAFDQLFAPDIGLSDQIDSHIDGTAITFVVLENSVSIHANTARVSPEYLDIIAARLAFFLAKADASATLPLAELPYFPQAERDLVLHGFNDSEMPLTGPALIHAGFETQVARNPDATALIFEDHALSYAALNTAANKLAHLLQELGVAPGKPVALHVARGPGMVIGALAILKAGGAYVPLDPAFPKARLAHYLVDSTAEIIVTEAALANALPDTGAQILHLDDPRIADAPASNPASAVGGDDLAYLIYTSGSTGTPKGVMVEHRNVANFFTGMDGRISGDDAGTWLAVTSLSFDISVLELFYTLSRGFRVVLSGDETRGLVAGEISTGDAHIDKHMDFSLFFWGNDDGAGPKKYQMLLDGARFADSHGFRAVWTPERHFHAFGGPYPNPSVTGAAIAAVTNNIDVRSGSCVAPLHHPARIAEEWAVIDNLTNGRAGLGIAAGWQPNDFVLRPENTPPNNKPAMFETIEKLRKLWRGEQVEFALADGTKHAIITQPRPVSKELPLWVTIAGNPDTWREAGEIGANVLTHLLGQSIPEVEGKIRIYHDALRKAGHDPADFTVTLMLHTYLADTREAARDTARGPMKEYLSSAAGLIKQFAWAFPAFKRPKGVSNAFELDLGVLTASEVDEILEHAFNRYFEDSGMFGTIEDALARTEQLKRIGVGEIACLIDYGIAPELVLEGLKPLAQVLGDCNQQVALADDDFSIAAQIRRHQVTHMQMTPSMAQMVAMNDASRGALAQVKHLYLGGEALPGPLVRELKRASPASIENMYGPTETCIWSSTGQAAPSAGVAHIGRPIANTQLYVLDDTGAPVPVGAEGELFIGGAGVTRGYWQRDAMTTERFLPNPFTAGRIYRTGDLVRRRPDGTLDFLGRCDGQVKLRGYRIELGEIEARLAALIENGAQVAVITREDMPGDPRLVAYLTAGAPVDKTALRKGLAKHLPDYMIPSHFVALDAMPLTPNKKIDRAALPAPTEAKTTDNVVAAFSQPQGDIERQIAEIWSRILGVAHIGANDNFFDLGGHSLLAVQAHREIKAALQVTKLSITDIFRHPTLSGLAEMLREKDPEPSQDDPASTPDQAAERADAMSRRRAMRAGRRRP